MAPNEIEQNEYIFQWTLFSSCLKQQSLSYESLLFQILFLLVLADQYQTSHQ